MVEIFEKRDIETFEPKLDLSILKRRGNSKTYKGLLIQKMKEARNDGNLDVVELLQWCYKEYLKFESKTKLYLNGWKGKSSFQVIKQPDSFIVVTYQKPSKDEEPKEIFREIGKEEINEVIITLNKLKDKFERIPTRAIGQVTYNKIWEDIFSDRHLHTKLNFILRILDYYGLIEYKGAKSRILNKKLDAQLLV